MNVKYKIDSTIERQNRILFFREYKKLTQKMILVFELVFCKATVFETCAIRIQ